jgi:hypothetical protein
VRSSTVWLRSPSFDWSLQLGALLGIAPALLLYAALGPTRASSLLPLASLVAIPFVHVFGSFFFAFSKERNQSPSSPRRLGVHWIGWATAVLAMQAFAPRALATLALVYGGWHILRQNFGFLRELAGRAGLGADRTLRRLDLAACAAPAVALWLFVSARGPWRFLTADVHHVPVPNWLLALAFAAVPATVMLRERWLAGRSASSRAALLLLAGNSVALLAPALFVHDLLLIYTLSASYHGFQYLGWLVTRERERAGTPLPTSFLLPLGSAILYCMFALFAALALIGWLFSPAAAERTLLVAWYAIVPFHYFVDGRIWRRPARAVV